MRRVIIISFFLLCTLSFSFSALASTVLPKEMFPGKDSVNTSGITHYISDLKTDYFLPFYLNESSGLELFDNKLWSHNDSGGKAELYGFAPSGIGKLVTVRISGALNHDWEDISHDSTYFYIGDFGNNLGNRKDLVIYKIPDEELEKKDVKEVQAGMIRFSFEDQKEFKALNRANNFDCESIFTFDDHLFLFSKDWIDGKSRLYELSKDTGTQVARLLGSFNALGLITGADISPDRKTLALIGYRDYVPFMWIIKGFEGDHFLSGNFERIDLPFLSGAQTEGIAFLNNQKLAVSCEKSLFAQQVFTFNLRETADTKVNRKHMLRLFKGIKVSTVTGNNGTILLRADITGLRGYTYSFNLLDSKENPVPMNYSFDYSNGRAYLVFNTGDIPPENFKILFNAGDSHMVRTAAPE